MLLNNINIQELILNQFDVTLDIHALSNST